MFKYAYKNEIENCTRTVVYNKKKENSRNRATKNKYIRSVWIGTFKSSDSKLKND